MATTKSMGEHASPHLAENRGTRRLFVLGTAALGFAGGCGSQTEPATPPVVVVPPEYRELVKIISIPAYPAMTDKNAETPIEEYVDNWRNAVAQLQKIHSTDPEIATLTEQSLDRATRTLRHLERLIDLPAPIGFWEATATGFAHGLIGNFPGMIATSLDGYQRVDALTSAAAAVIRAAEATAELQTEIPPIARKYATTATSYVGRIDIRPLPAWGWIGPDDIIQVQNDGASIEDCTIIVTSTVSPTSAADS